MIRPLKSLQILTLVSRDIKRIRFLCTIQPEIKQKANPKSSGFTMPK